MQFLLIAYDATDVEAPDRRMKSRAEHLEKIAHVKKAGQFINTKDTKVITKEHKGY